VEIKHKNNMDKKEEYRRLAKAYGWEKDLCHLIMIPFTGLGRPRYRGDEWFAKRAHIFKENTLKSIFAQTNPFFTLWMCFREEEATNPITQELWEYIQSFQINSVFTFGGIPMWDDKYPDDNLQERLQNVLPELKGVVGDAKYVYETILASDDMYHEDTAKMIHQQPFAKNKALIHWKGYIRDLETGKMADWQPTPNHLPPFYTIMYDAETFLDPKKHFDYLKEYKTHEDVEKLFDCVRLPDHRYIVNVHGSNISTSWIGYNPQGRTKHDFIGEEIPSIEQKEILSHFGL
jgi:hypothetical protein